MHKLEEQNTAPLEEHKDVNPLIRQASDLTWGGDSATTHDSDGSSRTVTHDGHWATIRDTKPGGQDWDESVYSEGLALQSTITHRQTKTGWKEVSTDCVNNFTLTTDHTPLPNGWAETRTNAYGHIDIIHADKNNGDYSERSTFSANGGAEVKNFYAQDDTSRSIYTVPAKDFTRITDTSKDGRSTSYIFLGKTVTILDSKPGDGLASESRSTFAHVWIRDKKSGDVHDDGYRTPER